VNTQTTKTSSNRKSTKIPQVKHFYDRGAAGKAKKLAEKALDSKWVKGAKKTGSKSKRGSSKSSLPTELFDKVTEAPIAVQIGALAVVAAGSYLLWKKRGEIQTFIKDAGDTVIDTFKGSRESSSSDESMSMSH